MIKRSKSKIPNNPTSILFICPVFNEESYIHQLISSLQNQSFIDWELLVVDNCSKDNTIEIVEKLSLLDQRILLHKFSESVDVWQSLIRSIKLTTLYSKYNYYMCIGADDVLVGENYIAELLSSFNWWTNAVIPRIINPLVSQSPIQFPKIGMRMPFSATEVLMNPLSNHLCFTIFRGSYFRSWAINMGKLIEPRSIELLIPFLALSTTFKKGKAFGYYFKSARSVAIDTYYPKQDVVIDTSKWSNDYRGVKKRYMSLSRSIRLMDKKLSLKKQFTLLSTFVVSYLLILNEKIRQSLAYRFN